MVLGALGAELGSDLLADATAPGNYTKIDEVQGLLEFETTTQLGVVDDGAIADDEVLAAVPGEVRLAALEEVLGEPLEGGGCGCHRELHKCGLPTGVHNCHHAIDGRLGVAVSRIYDLDPPDELGALLQAQQRRRIAQRRMIGAQGAVGIGGLQSRLNHPLKTRGTCDSKPDQARHGRVVNLERD